MSMKGIVTLTLNRPERLNAMTTEMLHDLADLAEEAARDPNTRVVVLKGSGRAFCAGIDLTPQRPIARTTTSSAETVDALVRVVRTFLDLPRPSVAVVHGPTAGLGIPLALSTDLVLASTDAYFELSFTKRGLMPDGGATALVAASIGRARAIRMALLAERLSAVDAERHGLIAAVSAPADLDSDADALVSALCAGANAALVATRRAINRATLASLNATFDIERAGQLELLLASDFREGAAAFVERRAPIFTDLTNDERADQ